MHLAELSVDTLYKIESYRWDRFIEKHEGPECWASTLAYVDPDFIEVAGEQILLPVDRMHHPHITPLRLIRSDDEQYVTLFLKDITFVQTPKDEFLYAGYVAICERVPGETFFVATFYHEWFLIDCT